MVSLRRSGGGRPGRGCTALSPASIGEATPHPHRAPQRQNKGSVALLIPRPECALLPCHPAVAPLQRRNAGYVLAAEEQIQSSMEPGRARPARPARRPPREAPGETRPPPLGFHMLVVLVVVGRLGVVVCSPRASVWRAWQQAWMLARAGGSPKRETAQRPIDRLTENAGWNLRGLSTTACGTGCRRPCPRFGGKEACPAPSSYSHKDDKRTGPAS